jgi:dolichyl-phosphate-mannose--protein O-mannosyl transferase
VFNIRPILYYLGITPEGYRTMIMAFGNPALHWGGLAAMIAMPIVAYREGDGRAFAIFIAYLMLLLPWVFIERPAFAYHYFPNLIFLSLAIAYVFDHMIRRRRGRYQIAIVSFTAVSVILFVMFYPTLSAWPLSNWYGQNVLRWFDSWPIYYVS